MSPTYGYIVIVQLSKEMLKGAVEVRFRHKHNTDMFWGGITDSAKNRIRNHKRISS